MAKAKKKVAKKKLPKKVAHETPKVRNRSKLGKLLDERGITQISFAEMIYEQTGEVILVTNLSNYCSGFKKIGSVKWAKIFSETLGVSMEDVVD